jgi:hypothetical protein
MLNKKRFNNSYVKVSCKIFIAASILQIFPVSEVSAQTTAQTLCQNAKTLRVVSRKTPKCSAGERRILKLPVVSGATGPTGAAGVDGAIGVTGAAGAVGPTGAAGATGVSGAVGPTGAAGATGVSGPTGPTGNTGATGATGAAGATGTSGVSGLEFMSRTNGNLADNTFYPLTGISAGQVSTDSTIAMPLPPGCSNLTGITAFVSAAPGVGEGRQFTIFRGTGTTLECVISDLNTTCSATGSIANTSPGQTLFSMRHSVSNIAVPAAVGYFTFQCD